MRSIISACLLSLLLTACGGGDETTSAENAAVDPVKGSKKTADTVVKDIENARDKLQWAGTYQGILPCANCDGVSTMLVIKPNMTYTIRSQMLGIDLKDKVSTGKFHWLPDNSAIVLEGKEQFKAFRFYPEFGEFRMPDGRPIPAGNRDQLQLRKTD